MSIDLAVREWRRGTDSLAAARLCSDGGYYADAISRRYYAVMHAAEAVLQLHDIFADSHAGVRRQFGQWVVVAGLAPPSLGAELGYTGNWPMIQDRKRV